MERKWPERWQPEAIAAVEPYVGADVRIEILRDDPQTTTFGTLYAGFVYIDDGGQLAIIHDKSGHRGIYPWKLPIGPILEVRELRPRRPAKVVYRHPDWTGPKVPRPAS